MAAWFEVYPPTKEDIEEVYALLEEVQQAVDEEAKMKVTDN